MVADGDGGDGGAGADDFTGGFVTKNHGFFEDEVADSAVLPVVDLEIWLVSWE